MTQLDRLQKVCALIQRLAPVQREDLWRAAILENRLTYGAGVKNIHDILVASRQLEDIRHTLSFQEDADSARHFEKALDIEKKIAGWETLLGLPVQEENHVQR